MGETPSDGDVDRMLDQVEALIRQNDSLRQLLANERRVNGELADRAARLAGCDCAACVKRAVEEEREESAKVAELYIGDSVCCDDRLEAVAADIRARGKDGGK